MQQQSTILSVSELTTALKSHIEPVFHHVCVRGEISNYKPHASGHRYFNLIDGGALLSAVFFKGSAAQYPHPLKDGDTVIASGEISLYPPRGVYQLIIRQISHAGLGEALLRLQALKKKLSDLGWFRPERKRAIPGEARRIGLVTSPTGAVLHDIYTILCRRMGSFHLIINPVRVQGEGAAFEIARAIQEFSTYSLVDVVIVCRGGGSSEDLAAFNEEIVAKACFESTIPIISAVGHETDVTIIDLVADLRAPTPSAAAELVSSKRSEQRQRLQEFARSTAISMTHRIDATKKHLSQFSKRLFHARPQKMIETYRIRLDDQASLIDETIRRSISLKKYLLSQFKRNIQQNSPLMRIARQKQQYLQTQQAIYARATKLITSRKEAIANISKRIVLSVQNKLRQTALALQVEKNERFFVTSLRKKIAVYRDKLKFFEQNLVALNPKKILERGYSIVFTKARNTVVRSIEEVSSGDSVQIMVSDGTLEATVQTIQRKE